MDKIKTTDDFQKYSQLLVADKIMECYVSVLHVLYAVRVLEQEAGSTVSRFPMQDPEPEQFADSYLKERVTGGDTEWLDGIVTFFLDIVYNYNKMNMKKQNEHNEDDSSEYFDDEYND